MTTNTAVEIGNHLAHLRDKAGFSQKDLAQKVTWSPAVLSRVESGERSLSKEELTAILEAIGTEDALDFSNTANRVWHYIEKPKPGHPGEPLLWRTEQVLSELDGLRQHPDIRHAFATRLEAYAKELGDTAGNVEQTEHIIAFIGTIGVGKTTALCRISNLEVPKESLGSPIPVLDCGGGGVTICEVHLAKGPGYGIIVEPRSADEIGREVLEFSKYLLPSVDIAPDPELEGQDFSGTSKEVERSIRNMSGLVLERRRRSNGTRRELLDPARNLAAEFNDPEGLATEILTRMKLSSRTRRELWFSDVSGKEPLPWLEEVFKQVNNGRHPEVSLPKHIDVLVPHRILSEEFLNIRLVDTKGIDKTAEREDLEAHFYDPNAVVVLCSAFNEAPSPSVQQLLTRAKAGNIRDLDSKAAVLVLPRPDEALAVKDDSGEPADTVEDGYELKGDQAKMQLAGIGVDHAAVEFFNAREDDPQRLTSFLLGMVHGLRDKHRERLEAVINGATALVQNFEQEQTSAVQQQAANFLKAWLNNNSKLEIVPSSLERSLLQAISKTNASSVRASINRQGEWHNLDCANQLAYGARLTAFDAVRGKLSGFKEVCQTALNDPDLAEAYPLIEQALRIFETGTDDLLRDSYVFGRTAFTLDLKPDTSLWEKCEGEWGKGPGYRDRVYRHHKAWFDADQGNIKGRAQSLVERQWRAILERVSSVLQVD